MAGTPRRQWSKRYRWGVSGMILGAVVAVFFSYDTDNFVLRFLIIAIGVLIGAGVGLLGHKITGG